MDNDKFVDELNAIDDAYIEASANLKAAYRKVDADIVPPDPSLLESVVAYQQAEDRIRGFLNGNLADHLKRPRK